MAFFTAGIVMVGVNVTLMVQVAPEARLVPQVLVWANCPGLSPPSEMPVIVTAELPGLVTVTAWADVVTFIGEWNVRLSGVTVYWRLSNVAVTVQPLVTAPV